MLRLAVVTTFHTALAKTADAATKDTTQPLTDLGGFYSQVLYIDIYIDMYTYIYIYIYIVRPVQTFLVEPKVDVLSTAPLACACMSRL